jgi:methyl coenzyme M reductase subunit C-like uncharacterized protein (methanogenesis marker protein 7)
MDAEEPIDYRLTHPHNLTQQKRHQVLNRDLVELLEKTIRDHNPFVKSFELMQEVEEQVNEQARAAGITPLEVQLIFTISKQTSATTT